MMVQNELENVVASLVREGFERDLGNTPRKGSPDPAWAAVRATGTRLWLDSGDIDEIARLWNSEFEAVTTNNTLLNKEVQKGIYDDLIRRCAREIQRAQPDVDQRELLLELAFILNAHHGLRLVQRFGAHVSVELHTDLADDLEKSVAYGRRYYAICPERFYVKVPLTPAGLIAARRLGQIGVPINLTLGFSARQNYLVALFSNPAYVNVFMGRLNQFVIENKLGDGKNVGEKATLATQREILRLRKSDRTRSLLIAASMRDAAQIPALAGLDVFTMPTKAAAQYRQSPASQITSRIQDDPPVTLSPGVRLEDFAGQTLWEVPDSFKKSVDKLVSGNISDLDPDAIVRHLQNDGFGDLFPDWTASQVQTAAKDGKIPVFETWRGLLSSRQIGMDALLNLSAMRSFATDQAALDGRVKGLLER